MSVQQDFINKIAPIVVEIAPKYNIKVCSPIIAQACLESGYGTSNKVYKDGEWRHNYFGLKWRDGRCAISNSYFEEWTAEQKSNGSYINIVSRFMKFNNMRDGVIGYFQWINTSNYSNLKDVTDPKTYLENIKKDGYATSINYVQNLMNVIDKYDLTMYDKEETNMKFTNSPLVNYTKISPNKTLNRTHVIDTITIHCVVGQCTAESLGNVFANTSRHASSNYGVDKDGRIGLYVEEKDRSWCSSNTANDDRAITIEVASDNFHPYAVTDKAFNSLIKLCADICKRNGIKELKWKADKNLIGKVDQQNMTVHRWFAQKSCPGEYLFERHGLIASEVNKILNPTQPTVNIKVKQFNIEKGNSQHFTEIIKNLKLAINTDFGTKMDINDGTITNELLIHLSNIVLSLNVTVPNVIYVLQQIFVWWGFNISLNGLYDVTTANTVGTFQSLTNIAVTKTTTKDTWYKLLGK